MNTDLNESSQTIFQNIVACIKYLKNRQYKMAVREIFTCLKNIYLKHLKGKYVVVRGKKIPRTAIAVVAMCLLVSLCCCPNNDSSLSESYTAEANTYDKNGIRVYDLRKCNQAVCGFLENATQESYAKITIFLNFHNETGEVVYEGGVDASEVGPMSRIKVKVPSKLDFAYFKLVKVKVNKEKAEEEDDEEE